MKELEVDTQHAEQSGENVALGDKHKTTCRLCVISEVNVKDGVATCVADTCLYVYPSPQDLTEAVKSWKVANMNWPYPRCDTLVGFCGAIAPRCSSSAFAHYRLPFECEPMSLISVWEAGRERKNTMGLAQRIRC